MAHQWRFFRSGGFDQVRLDKIEDWRHLSELDPKLWAALSCPVKGLEFDQRTMEYLDSDHDGRVRIDEVKAAVAWVLSVLQRPEVVLSGSELPLDAIDVSSDTGKRLVASARRILANLGQENAGAISCSHTDDFKKVFPSNQLNGDGIVTLALTQSEAVNGLVTDIIAAGFVATDRSGDVGVDKSGLDAFIAEVTAFLEWEKSGTTLSLPLGEATAETSALVQCLDNKVNDYFTRCQLCAYDENATAGLNGTPADFAALSRQVLNEDLANIEHLPIAKVVPNGDLPLMTGLHPHWASKLLRLRQLIVPLFGVVDELTTAQWQQLKEHLASYSAWQAAKPTSNSASIEKTRLLRDLNDATIAELNRLIEDDLAQMSQAESVLDVDKLIRFQANLRHLLHNFVNLESFYQLENKAMFQNGRLYIDGKSCDLCMQVNDSDKHAKMAGLGGTYLLYLDCVRHATGEKKSIVAAVTAGESGNLMVGRNGVYYDRKGVDWDATVVRIVENPISIREAFFTPYRRIGRMVSEQIQKFAAAKDKNVEALSATSVDAAAMSATAGAKPAAPAPFDVAKFAGIFAAIGLAIGAIGTAVASVLTGFMGLLWWQMPLCILGIVVLISGPSMLLGWLKLRNRNLAPLLDANGWAVNSNAKLSIAFGTRLTSLATLPAGSRLTLSDPFAVKSHWGLNLVLLLCIIAGAVAWCWHKGYFAQWL